MTMQWKNWADTAYQHQVRLVGWPAGIRTPGPGFDPKVHVGTEQLRKMVDGRIQAMENVESVAGFVEIVSWSDGR